MYIHFIDFYLIEKGVVLSAFLVRHNKVKVKLKVIVKVKSTVFQNQCNRMKLRTAEFHLDFPLWGKNVEIRTSLALGCLHLQWRTRGSSATPRRPQRISSDTVEERGRCNMFHPLTTNILLLVVAARIKQQVGNNGRQRTATLRLYICCCIRVFVNIRPTQQEVSSNLLCKVFLCEILPIKFPFINNVIG